MRYPKDGNRSTGRAVLLTAPVRGLKTNSALVGLGKDYAITLDNLICQPDALVSRLGYVPWATGLSGANPVLCQYHSGTVDQLFVATSTGMYNCTSQGALGASLAARTAGNGCSANYSTSAGQFMYYVNGVDKPLLYNGSSFVAVDGASTPAITGPNTSTFAHVTSYRRRLFFLATGKLSFYYLPTDSVGGGAVEFNIGSMCSRGGTSVGQASWSIDGGQGPDDMYVIATSEGEIIVFSGSDPSLPADWAVKGVFYIGKPVGRDCFVKLGGDLLYLSENGVYPLSKALLSASSSNLKTLTYNIDPTISAAIQNYGASSGWQILTIPQFALVLINVPASPAKQYVYNTISGGWSSFSGMNARSWATFQGSVYFASTTGVYKAFTGVSDNGSAIPWEMTTAYNSFGSLGQSHPLLVRPLIAQNVPSQYEIGFSGDFSGAYASQTVEASTSGNLSYWNSGLWDVNLWGGGFILQRDWRTVAANGGWSLSLRLAGASNAGSTVILGAGLKLSQQGLVV